VERQHFWRDALLVAGFFRAYPVKTDTQYI
jgi:hypothetical protein